MGAIIAAFIMISPCTFEISIDSAAVMAGKSNWDDPPDAERLPAPNVMLSSLHDTDVSALMFTAAEGEAILLPMPHENNTDVTMFRLDVATRRLDPPR